MALPNISGLQISSDEAGYHHLRAQQKLLLGEDEFYKRPGYRAQEEYTQAIRDAVTKRQEAEYEVHLADKDLYKAEKDKKNRAIAEHNQRCFATCLAQDEKTSELEQEVKDASDPAEISAAQARLASHQAEAESIKADALETCRVDSLRAVTDEIMGRERVANQSLRERVLAYREWCRELEAARETLLEAHRNDTESAIWWEAHPPDPRLDKYASSGTHYEICYQ